MPTDGPSPGDTIEVRDIACKDDCRAYRVFQYYIDKMVETQQERVYDDEELANTEESIFM